MPGNYRQVRYHHKLLRVIIERLPFCFFTGILSIIISGRFLIANTCYSYCLNNGVLYKPKTLANIPVKAALEGKGKLLLYTSSSYECFRLTIV